MVNLNAVTTEQRNLTMRAGIKTRLVLKTPIHSVDLHRSLVAWIIVIPLIEMSVGLSRKEPHFAWWDLLVACWELD